MSDAPASTPATLALAAASQAAEALAELIRFAREGEGNHGPFEDEVVMKLLDATKMAIEAMGEAGSEFSDTYGHLCATLEFWA